MNELASNHAEVNTTVLDRIGDWKHHLKEAVLLENNEGKENEQDRNRQAVCGRAFTQDPIHSMRTKRRR